MAQMRDCADAHIRLASVARGAIEPKGAAGTAQGIFWKSPLPSVCRRGTMAPDCDRKLPNQADSVALGGLGTRPCLRIGAEGRDGRVPTLAFLECASALALWDRASKSGAAAPHSKTLSRVPCRFNSSTLTRPNQSESRRIKVNQGESR